MIHVVHVITKLELGGAQQNTLHTVGHLDRRRFQPYLITGPGGPLMDEARALEDVELTVVPSLIREVQPIKDLSALFRLTSILRRIRRQVSPDPVVVHTHCSKAGILGRSAAWAAGCRHRIHSVHGYGFHPGQSPWVHRLYVELERLTSRITSRFILVSRSNMKQGIALGLFQEHKAELIRSGIDIELFRDAPRDGEKLRKELGLEEDGPVIGMVACLKPQKAPTDFVRAAHIISSRLPHAYFLLAGDGTLRPDVERLASERGLQDRFKLLGWRRDVPRLMKMFDVLVLTSRWEGLPRVFPQAMAAGVPIVACRVDGAPEAVVDGESGYLVEPGDMETLADRVVELLEDPEKARAMVHAGEQRLDEFDINQMVRKQEDLYGSICNEPTA